MIVLLIIEKEKTQRIINRGNKKVMGQKIKCKKCGDIIQSLYRHDYKSCKCGEIFIDGGNDYLRCGANDLENIIDLDDNGNEIRHLDHFEKLEKEEKEERDSLYKKNLLDLEIKKFKNSLKDKVSF